MKTHQEILRLPFVQVGLSGLMFGALLLLSGCEQPAGPPGARPLGHLPTSRVPEKKEMPIRVAQLPSPVTPATSGKTPDATGEKRTESAPEESDNPLKPAPASRKKPDGDLPDEGASSTEQRVNPMASIFKVERAGNTVKLASELIFSQANPFLDLLARPAAPQIADTGKSMLPMDLKPPPPPDPFEHVSLTGIAYHAAAPMAVLSLDGGEAQSQLVRRGDILMADGGRIRVVRINRDNVELETLGKTREKRTIALPNVVGYAPSGRDSGKTASSEKKPEITAQAGMPPAGAGNDPPSGMPVLDVTNLYRNLQKLTGQTPTAQPQTSGPGLKTL